MVTKAQEHYTGAHTQTCTYQIDESQEHTITTPHTMYTNEYAHALKPK